MRRGPGVLHLALASMLVLAGCASGPVAPGPVQRGGGDPAIIAPDDRGLDRYSRHKLYASSQLDAGDYASALSELEAAAGIRQDEPVLFELLGLAYDGDRQPSEAYESFLKAGQMYLASGDTDRALGMLGWIRSYRTHATDGRARAFEEALGRARTGK